MTPARTAPQTRRGRETHGLTGLKRSVNVLGSRAIDMRTTLGKALAAWRSELVADLGGRTAISTQQAAVIDLAVKTKLLLDSIDSWLLVQPSLIDKRRRSVLPVVRERQQLADALNRYMTTLGLERRAKSGPSLEDYLRAKAAERANGPAAPRSTTDGAPHADDQTFDDRATAADDDDEAGR